MIHPHTEMQFISPEIGFGVVATKFIPAGTITWALDKLDREFSPEAFQSMEPLYQEILDTYSYRNGRGDFVLCWDLGRYVNHSFNSNCISTAYDFELAIRDIQPGEQLTDDYGYLNVVEPFQGIDEGTVRKIVYPDDLLFFAQDWDKKLLGAFPKINSVTQPLISLLSAEIKEEISAIREGKKQMASIKNLYFDPKKIK